MITCWWLLDLITKISINAIKKRSKVMYNSSPSARDIGLRLYKYENEVVYDSNLTEKNKNICFLPLRSEDTEKRARYDKLLFQLISISHVYNCQMLKRKKKIINLTIEIHFHISFSLPAITSFFLLTDRLPHNYIWRINQVHCGEWNDGREMSNLVFLSRTLKLFSKKYLEVTSELKTAIIGIGRSLFWTTTKKKRLRREVFKVNHWQWSKKKGEFMSSRWRRLCDDSFFFTFNFYIAVNLDLLLMLCLFDCFMVDSIMYY